MRELVVVPNQLRLNSTNGNGVLQAAFGPLGVESAFEAQRGFFTQVPLEHLALVAHCGNGMRQPLAVES